MLDNKFKAIRIPVTSIRNFKGKGAQQETISKDQF